MAALLLVRLIILASPAEAVAARYVLSGGSTPATPVLSAIQSYIKHLLDFGNNPDELSAALSAQSGEEVRVVDYTTNVDLRKLQVRYQRTPAGGVVEDIAVTTHHFLKLTGGAPDGNWVAGNFTTVENAFTAFWGSIRALYTNTIALGQYRWYKSGATWDVTPAPYNPAERITEVNTLGSGAGATSLPPQDAISVTEKTALRPSWGRFYLPAPSVAVCAGDGRIPSANQDTIAAAAVTFYNTCRAASLLPVVFGRARGEYVRKDEVVLPPKPAIAYEVLAIQVDDIFDVIRSRRWETVSRRVTTALT